MTFEKDIIDLTADLSDLEATPTLSSARKRSRQAPASVMEADQKKAKNCSSTKRRNKAKRVRLIGEPFVIKATEKHYRAVQYADMSIEVNSMITSDFGQGLVRRLVVKRRESNKEKVVLCHVHWFGKSACGIKGEVFLKHGDCGDIKLDMIKSVHPMTIGAQGQADNGQADSRPLLRHVFQHAYNVWRDPVLVDKKGDPVCDSCLSAEKPLREEYHLFDTVLVEEKDVNPNSPSLVWRVARIVQLDTDTNTDTIKIQLFKRYSDQANLMREPGFVSERRLLLSDVYHRIPIAAILCRAHVTHQPISLDQHNASSHANFYCHERIRQDGLVVDFAEPLPACIPCTAPMAATQNDYQRFLDLVKLPAIDYYSGGGGGMIGAKGYFHHVHAVEMDEGACHTLRENWRRTKVHQTTVGEASEAARKQDIVKFGKRGANLPRPGSMVLASAGPPCQGHTGANHRNQVDDPRNSELFVAINEIKRLKPDIFILENVPGLKRDRNKSSDKSGGGNMSGSSHDDESTNFAVEGIKRLRNIGYQARMVQLDARSFGSPQNRIRLFLICARKGVPLPSIPSPTHANPHLERNLFVGGSNSNRSFYVGERGTYGSAPMPAVTVLDAISDLPQFEYQYVNQTLSQRSHMPRFDPLKAAGNRVGFLVPVPYHTPPANDFQARQRTGSAKIENHYTPPWTPRELDIIFASDAFVGQKTPSDLPGPSRRINPDRGATTLLTSSGPGGKYTGPIHYNQRRTLTVAERKRLQGVPDKYHICCHVDDKDRQIGNMINVHVSRALHGHIHREVFYKAWVEMGKPVNFLEQWRELHPI